MTGLKLPKGTMKKLFAINKAAWRDELVSIAEFFKKFGQDLPKELRAEYKALEKRIAKL